MPNQKKPYRIVVHADPDGLVGHFSVSLIRPDGTRVTYGKYPESGTKNRALSAFGADVPGEIRDDSNYQTETGDIETDELDLTESQGKQVEAYFRNAIASPQTYNLYDDSCIDFVEGALDASGTDTSILDAFKGREEDIDRLGTLGSLYGAGDEVIRRKRRDQFDEIEEDRDDGLPGHPRDHLPDGASLEKESETDSLAGNSGRDDFEAKQGRAFLKDLSIPPEGVEGVLLKQPRDWTEKELGEVMASDRARLTGHPEFGRTNDKVVDWFANHYGTEPVKYDMAGRTIEPKPKIPPRRTPAEARGLDGKRVVDGALSVGRQVAEIAGKDKWAAAISILQSGLNLLNAGGLLDGEASEGAADKGSAGGGQISAKSAAAAEPRAVRTSHGVTVTSAPKPRLRNTSEPPAPVKEDGLFGPKTKGALYSTVAEKGADKVSEAVSLAGTRSKLHDLRRGSDPDSTLGSVTNTHLRPLFTGRDPGHDPDDPRPKPWNRGVQATLNELGQARLHDWTPLKEDGWIGPRTESAFKTLLSRTDPDELIGGFADHLGLA